MHIIGAIWAIYFLMRLFGVFGRSNANQKASTASGWSFFQERGRVRGQNGPDGRSFKGRAGREEWWIGTIWNSAIGAFAGIVPSVGPLLSLPWIIGGLAVNTRRLHDMRRSGWWQIAPMIPAGLYAGALALDQTMHWSPPGQGPIALSTPAQIAEALLFAIAAIAYLGLFGMLGIARGTQGPNVYGEAD